MSKFVSPLAIAGVLLSLPFLGAAQALELVTFVSGKGVNTGTCGKAANPCRTFQFAVNNTSLGGEVKALDPAEYGPIVITKSISISGVEGASINHADTAVTINALAGLAGDRINLSRLTITGRGSATNGIVLNTGGSLTITNCTVRNFSSDGIRIASGGTNFLISHTLVSDNGSIGVDVLPSGAPADGTIDHVTAIGNNYGINVDGRIGRGARVTIVDSIAANNTDSGIVVGRAAVFVRDTVVSNNRINGLFVIRPGIMTLAHVLAMGNGVDVAVFAGGTAQSFGDNNISDRIVGTLTPVATQ